jgi:hypothetical protein
MLGSVRAQYATTAHYNRTQHLVHLKGERVLFNPDAADDAADRAFDGGYDLAKSNLCGDCFTYKSANGTCNCPQED